MKLVVGLGNLEERYDHTRHNVGFHWLDGLANLHGLRFSDNKKFFGLTCKLSESRGDVWLLKPGVYMNNSGRSVGAIASFFNFSPSEILIVHDELDLPNGYIKLKKSGGHGGHNGLRNIIDQMQGENNFKRLRLGIGHPGKGKDVITYVLKKASKKDRSKLEKTFDKCNSIGELIMTEGWEKTIMHFHTGKGASIES